MIDYKDDQRLCLLLERLYESRQFLDFFFFFFFFSSSSEDDEKLESEVGQGDVEDEEGSRAVFPEPGRRGGWG